jgi:hypothetical protein
LNVTMVNCSKDCDAVSIVLSCSGDLGSWNFSAREFELCKYFMTPTLDYLLSTQLFYELCI